MALPKTATLMEKIPGLMATQKPLDLTEFFVSSCIAGTLEFTVENASAVMADIKFFPKTDIDLMHTLKLEDIAWDDNPVALAQANKFKIYDRNNPEKFIMFSNRAASNFELRGPVLRDRLGDLK